MNRRLHTRRPLGRFFCCLISLLLAVLAADASGPATTSVTDTVYRADGTPAAGTLVIAWNAFTTPEAISNREILDEGKFREGLSKIIDGTVQCLNSSTWAKQ